mmetsp:Transcript_19619/g.29574  ORF Transcript_19619/g.29574 Transcript_19619/m.29574 type:complete len:86 (+) Transcript_19619:1315-1572(+)
MPSKSSVKPLAFCSVCGVGVDLFCCNNLCDDVHDVCGANALAVNSTDSTSSTGSVNDEDCIVAVISVVSVDPTTVKWILSYWLED